MLSGLSGAITWLGAALFAAVAWRTLRNRTFVGTLLVEAFLGFGAAAALLYSPNPQGLGSVSPQFQRVAAATPGVTYLRLFLLVSVAVWAGALLGVIGKRPSSHRLSPINLTLPPLVLFASLIPATLFVVGIGPSTLLQANAYLATTGPHVAVIIGKTLAPIAIIICGYFIFSGNNPWSIRILGLLLAVFYELTYFATDTRFLALWFPLIFLGGWLANSWSPARKRVLTISTVLLSLFSLQIPIGLRGLPGHGLLASWHYLLYDPSDVFGGRILNNLLLGAPLSNYVGHYVNPLSRHELVTALNPLPSQFTDWSAIAPLLRLNPSNPYSAIGELLNHGKIALCIAMVVFGFSFCIIERIAARCRGTLGTLARVVPIGSSTLFMIQCTEYNLRSVTRLAYDAAAISIVLLVASRQIVASDEKKSFDSSDGRGRRKTVQARENPSQIVSSVLR